MYRAFLAMALLAVFATWPATGAAGGGSDNTGFELVGNDITDDGEQITYAKVISSSRCQKNRTIDLVVEKPGEDKVADTAISGKRGGFAVLLRKGDVNNATGLFLKAHRSQAGATTCEGKKKDLDS